MDSYRHHVATRPVVVFVPVPCGGSPETWRRQPPPAYPVNQRSPWRPATRPPHRLSKAEALKRLLDEFRRQDQIVREMMTPRPDLLRAWLAKAA
jgi:hypothetical protein